MRNAKSVVRSHIFACVLVDNSASLLLAASCVPQPRVLKSPLQNHCKIQYFLSVLLERLSCLSFVFYSVFYTFVPTLLGHLPFLFGLAFGHTFGCFFDFQNDAKSPSSPVHRRMFSELFVFSVLGVPWRHFGGSLEPRDGGSGHKKVVFFTNFPF